MNFIKTIMITVLAFGTFHLLAQEADYPISAETRYAQYNVDKIQQQFLDIEDKADRHLLVGNNEVANHQFTTAATITIDSLQKQIELDSTLQIRQKQTYLRGLGETIMNFSKAFKAKKNKLADYPKTLKAWETAFMLEKDNKSISPIFNQYPAAIYNLLVRNNSSFNVNPDVINGKDKMAFNTTSQTLKALNAGTDTLMADSIIESAAKKDPEVLYTYAQANNSKLGKLILANNDPLVKLIYKLANDNNGQIYLPFLDDLLGGKITTDEIKSKMESPLSYYRLLVKTQIAYAGRIAKGDTPLLQKPLQEMIHIKSRELFVNSINGLHESPDAIRFRAVEPLTAIELYYLMVSSEDEIYTSSYTGVYKRLWQRMAVPNADTLLASVNYNHFKKFISMAANYNELDDFLGRMNKGNSTVLMTEFVNNLDKGKGNDLEDAVDVANSYASINGDTIKNLMLQQIIKNYDRSKIMGNKRAEKIYRLEHLILGSSDTANKINLTDSLGILPVYEVKNDYLKDSEGRIVLQMYFSGDGTGRGSFDYLKRLYTNKQWKREDSPEWVQFTSVHTAVPFIILANRPGQEEKNEDGLSQKHLNQWMAVHETLPSITVHRGHSYQLNETIRQLSTTNKIIILGSCGGYNSIRDILNVCPDAYLIASKQTGFGSVNVPLFSLLIDELKNGHDIDWKSFWKLLEKKIGGGKNNGFDDYIPPYKNLGAIFINAYNKS